MPLKKANPYFTLLSLVTLCIASHLVATGQPVADHSQETMQIKGQWSKHANLNASADPALPYNQYPIIYKQAEKLASLLQQTYPDPTGLEAVYYLGFNQTPLFKGAPASYVLNSMYKSYYFNTHLNKIVLGTETETTVRIRINHFGNYMEDAGEWMIDGQLTRVYSPWEQEATWNGYPVYKNDRWGVDVKMGQFREKSILITRDGKQPYLPLTQKQYLIALKQKLENDKHKMSDSYMQAEKERLKIMEENKNNKFMSAEMKEKLNATLQKDFDKYMQTRDESIRKINEQFDKKIKIITDYLSSHPERELQQAVVTAYPWNFPGYFGPDAKKRNYTPVRIDPSYFDTKLPRHTPQLIVVQWLVGKDAPKIDFGQKFESGFDVSSLKAMIDDKKKIEVTEEDRIVIDLKGIRLKAEKYADSIIRRNPVIPVTSTTGSPDTSFTIVMPSRNEKVIGMIPKKKLNSVELKAYLENIDKNYTALLLQQGIKLPDVSSMGSGDISSASTLSLVKGTYELAAWFAIKAAKKAPGNIVILNNSGGVLNACGFQPVAVPILETALEKAPGNSTLQNNLGQAYVVVGDLPKAASLLQSTISTSPYHPHANYTMACLEYAKGNKAGALKYVEKSIRGSFTDGAWHLLYKLKPSARLMDYFKGNYKPTDYFNEDKYHLPRQCEKTSEVRELKAEYEAYRNMVEKVKKEFNAINNAEVEAGVKSIKDKVKNSSLRYTPFTELGTAMVLDATLRFNDEQEELKRAQLIYHKQISLLDQAYRLAYSNTHECGAILALGDKYMEAMAIVTREYQKKWLPLYKNYFNDFAYWSQYSMTDTHVRRGVYAGIVNSYLGVLLQLAETHFLYLCEPNDDLKKEQEKYVMPEQDCPIDIGLDVAIGSFHIDCDQMEYHFGGLLVADVTHSFRDHRTSIAIGAGLDVKFGGERLKAGPIQGGFQATGKMQYFLTFDGTQPSDQGFIWEGAIKYKQKIKTDNEEIGDIKTTSVDLSAKTVLSVHNGFTNKGTLYKYLDKIFE